MAHRGLACAALTFAILGAATTTRAQPPDAATLFDRGTEALLAGRFPEARDLLGESLRLEPDPATAFNLIVALLGLEEPLGAARLCETLLAEGYGPIPEERRSEAEAQCRRARSEVSVLRVEVLGAEGASVRVDGELVPAAPGALVVLVDPGAHVVTAEAPGHQTTTRRVRVVRGIERTLSISLPETADHTWWYVGGAAAGVAVIAAVVVTVLLVTRESDNSLPGLPVDATGR